MRRCYSDFDFDFDFDGFMFGMGPRRKHRRKRRRFKWRIFERGDLKFVVLRILSENPMHGYEVMKALEKESGGYYRPSPGSVYPTLQMLEDEGYLKAEDKDGKKVYSITKSGQKYLDENADVVDEVFDRVDELTDRFFGQEVRDLSKAFSRLAQMTYSEAFRWGADKEVIAKMTEILETAAGEMGELREKSRGPRRGKRRSRRDSGKAAEESSD